MGGRLRKLTLGRLSPPSVLALGVEAQPSFCQRKTPTQVVSEPRCTYRRPPSGKTGARGVFGVEAQPCFCQPEKSHTGGFRAQMYRRPPPGKTGARGFWSRGTTQAYRQFPTEVVSESRCTGQIEGHIRETPVQSAFDFSEDTLDLTVDARRRTSVFLVSTDTVRFDMFLHWRESSCTHLLTALP
uniref:Uncharacterized protein n=1 Tax=Noctiluca scintillans TaxID=2966 RepID=A0A7S1AHW7_NOCSC